MQLYSMWVEANHRGRWCSQLTWKWNCNSAIANAVNADMSLIKLAGLGSRWWSILKFKILTTMMDLFFFTWMEIKFSPSPAAWINTTCSCSLHRSSSESYTHFKVWMKRKLLSRRRSVIISRVSVPFLPSPSGDTCISSLCVSIRLPIHAHNTCHRIWSNLPQMDSRIYNFQVETWVNLFYV